MAVGDATEVGDPAADLEAVVLADGGAVRDAVGVLEGEREAVDVVDADAPTDSEEVGDSVVVADVDCEAVGLGGLLADCAAV